MKKLVQLLKDESGVTAIEYGLIAAFIGLALIAVMPGLSGSLKTLFQQISDHLAPAA